VKPEFLAVSSAFRFLIMFTSDLLSSSTHLVSYPAGDTMKTEAEIRDYLAEHLDVIEPGLQLYEKELYIPSEIGTRSFIDLVARNPKGELVLIETGVSCYPHSPG
jgi:RecB family endonuclease NucS